MKVDEKLKKQRESWKFLRMGKGIILEEVAQYVGCHFTYINKWENGHINMASEKLERYKEYIKSK